MAFRLGFGAPATDAQPDPIFSEISPLDAALSRRERGETVIMDNLSVRKVAGVREAIEAAGAYVLYLPSIRPT